MAIAAKSAPIIYAKRTCVRYPYRPYGLLGEYLLETCVGTLITGNSCHRFSIRVPLWFKIPLPTHLLQLVGMDIVSARNLVDDRLGRQRLLDNPHAQGLRRAGGAGARDAQARSAQRASVCVPRPARRAAQGALA